MFSLFRKSSNLELRAPLIGRAEELSNVPDPVFSSKMMGDGIAILPREGVLYSPVNGVISHVFPTKHAVGIVTDEGLEILLHIGVDTVNLMGEGFECFVMENQRVNVGDKLISFDINSIQNKVKSIITPMLITNMDMVDGIEFNYGDVTNNSIVMVVKTKKNYN